MDFTTMTTEELETRKTAIGVEVDGEGADLDALEAEVKGINAELEARRNAEAAKAEIRSKIAEGILGETTKEFNEVTTMSDTVITRNSPEYIHAFAEYVKTGNDAECRSLLTENATSGTVAVPDLVQRTITHAWDNEGVVALLKKTYIKGNIKQGFEIAGDAASVHTEGGEAVTEESLTLGIVTMVPQTIKKWIGISDECLDLDDGSFLEYIYAEIAHRIAEKISALFVGKVVAASTSSTSTACGQPKITAATIAINTIAEAIAQLSDEASNPVIVMNKLTYADFKGIQYANKYNVDPFEGLKVVFSNAVTAYSSATTGDCYAIVGDFGKGGQANFPNGDGIQFKFDDLTLATSDLVKVIGRTPVALGIVAPECFTRICK